MLLGLCSNDGFKKGGSRRTLSICCCTEGSHKVIELCRNALCCGGFQCQRLPRIKGLVGYTAIWYHCQYLKEFFHNLAVIEPWPGRMDMENIVASKVMPYLESTWTLSDTIGSKRHSRHVAVTEHLHIMFMRDLIWNSAQNSHCGNRSQRWL